MSNDALPDFYMSDYSVIGLLVDNLDKAHQVLEDHKFEVMNKSDHLEVSIDRADQMYEIANLLDQNGIDCGVADIIDQVYQG
ncbi:MAG: hypothetical protein JSW26_02765 [Desulfobacterales bacterium]|nr:MAG: hypothetical protein JSW26_02765 [Desulfobacterales bacterium]